MSVIRKKRPFNSEHVIDEYVKEETLRAYHVGFENGVFRLIPLVETIRKVIPEFALGLHEGSSVPITDMIDRLCEAAQVVYTTDKYKNRGEFGELILHLLLRDFCDTIPLVSKIYFKDTINMPAHGFDCVHVSEIDGDKYIWLGESKLYTSGLTGVRDLAKDAIKHVNGDFLRTEFLLIKRKLPISIDGIEYWRELMHPHRRLSDVFSNVIIPMVATYNSELLNTFTSESEDYFNSFVDEANLLHADFLKHIAASPAKIVLFLLPVKDKNLLNEELDKRLKAMQSI